MEELNNSSFSLRLPEVALSLQSVGDQLAIPDEWSDVSLLRPDSGLLVLPTQLTAQRL